MEEYIVYANVNSDGFIIAVNSSGFLEDIGSWTEIDHGIGDKYYHAQGNYFPLSIMTEGGAYRYKLVDGKPQVCTQEEIQEQENANQPSPSQEERLQALETQNEMLVQCILEMSEIVYV